MEKRIFTRYAIGIVSRWLCKRHYYRVNNGFLAVERAESVGITNPKGLAAHQVCAAATGSLHRPAAVPE
jgi:hypothetical protein